MVKTTTVWLLGSAAANLNRRARHAPQADQITHSSSAAMSGPIRLKGCPTRPEGS
jgi:hypothetical protein